MRGRVSRPFLLLTAVLVLLGDRFLLLCWAAALVHEAGHLCALRLMRCPVERAALTAGGLRIEYRPGGLSYRQDALTALAGPAANLLTALLLAPAARRSGNAVLYQTVGCSLLLAGINLLPALPLDGGRVLAALWAMHGDPDRAARGLYRIGTVLGILLLFAGCALTARGGNPTLLLLSLLLLRENLLRRGERLRQA